MTNATLKEIVHGRVPFDWSHLDDVLGEARAAIGASPHPAAAWAEMRKVVLEMVAKVGNHRGVGDGYFAQERLKSEFHILSAEQVSDVVAGRCAFEARHVDALFDEIRLAVDASPSKAAALRDVYDAVTRLLEKIIGNRGLGDAIAKAMKPSKVRTIPPDERTAMFIVLDLN